MRRGGQGGTPTIELGAVAQVFRQSLQRIQRDQPHLNLSLLQERKKIVAASATLGIVCGFMRASPASAMLRIRLRTLLYLPPADATENCRRSPNSKCSSRCRSQIPRAELKRRGWQRLGRTLEILHRLLCVRPRVRAVGDNCRCCCKHRGEWEQRVGRWSKLSLPPVSW